MNAHHNSGGVFSATEATNVKAFVAAGHKAVIITDNNGWSNFNAGIESVVDATITDTCESNVGTATGGHALGAGVGTVNHGCGSVLDPAANAQEIVSNGIASLYSVGLGEVLVITSVDLFRGATPLEPEFMQNISTYLDDPIDVAPVPLPASVPLLLAGLGALGAVARRKRRA